MSCTRSAQSTSSTVSFLVYLLALAPLLMGFGCNPSHDPDRFGIYTSKLDGSDMRKVTTDAYREINHARFSPDKKWITFTRYNRKGLDGLAKEDGNYIESEIMLVRPDGSELQSLVPARPGIVSANGYWSPDGTSILYVSNDNPKKQGQISRVDLASRAITAVKLSGEPWAADPHAVGSKMAFSVFSPDKKTTSIWIIDQEKNVTRQLTSPKAVKLEGDAKAPPGDFDPKISPDGTKVALMRHAGEKNWHIVVVDLLTNKETLLSSGTTVDGVPEWSSDGRKLIFWHVNVKDIKESGLYIMNPDGTTRQRIPLPRGYFYTMPAFLPGEGSSPDTRIIFSAQKNPHL